MNSTVPHTTKPVITPLSVKAEPAADMLSISVRKLAMLTASGEIPVCKISKRLYLYKVADLEAFLDKRRVRSVV